MSLQASNTAEATAKVLVQILKIKGFKDAKINHFRKEGLPFAVEVGYVYGETTVRMNRLHGQVDKGTIETLRGVGDDFVVKATKYLEDCTAKRYVVDPAEHGFGEG